MLDNETVLVDKALADAQASRATPLDDDRAFELFACQQVLRDEDLSEEEIEAGSIGGGGDGAIDGVYVFLNGNLLAEDSEQLHDDFLASNVQVASTLRLVMVQAKRSESFTETAVDLVQNSTRRLLTLAEDDEALAKLYSAALIQRMNLFRSALRRFAGRHLQVKVEFYYVTRGRSANVNAKVAAKAKDLERQFERVIVKATGRVEFFGGKELWTRVSAVPNYTLGLACQEYATKDASYVALVALRDYIDFLRDESGVLRRYIFDWNVRDYQGRVEVNREIRRSLEEDGLPEFWWLNNGVTIVCSKASIVSKTFHLDDVQVVNGLQTSQTIFDTLASAADDHPSLDRCVLVRILEAGDDTATRDQVIRATNRQTSVPEASLRATDEIQRNIEKYFGTHDLYYDRRKNYYRNVGKPLAKIVSIPFLAQSVMAMGLGEPDNSRARPSSLLKNEADYKRVFDPALSLDIYLWLAKTQKAVDLFLTGAGVAGAERTNLKFHVAMLAVAAKLGKRVYHPSELLGLAACDAVLDDTILAACLAQVRTRLAAFANESGGSVDKTAKGREFVEHLLEEALPQLLA